MNIVRRMTLVLLGSALLVSLPLAVWGHIGHVTIRQRDTVNGWLEESGFYDRVVEAVLENANEQTGEGEQQLPLDDPQIQSIADSAFSPDFIRQNIEKVLDGTYAWLEGKTARPEFSVDLGPAKQRLADGLSNYAANRAEGLPACTAAQLQAINLQELDLLSTPCLPPGVDVNAAAADLRSEILHSDDFLGKTAITGEDLFTQEDGSVAGNQERVQSAYKSTRNLPILFAVIAVLSVAGIIFLSDTRRKGIRRTGAILLTVAGALAISYLGIQAGAKLLREHVTNAGGDTTAGRKLAQGLSNVISHDIAGLLGWYALGIGLLGLALVVASIVIGRKGSAEQPDGPHTMRANDESAAGTAAGPGPTEKPDRPKRKEPPKIQL